MENSITSLKTTADKIPSGRYLAKIIFQVVIGESSGDQFDEQYRVVSANSFEDAREKSAKIGLE